MLPWSLSIIGCKQIRNQGGMGMVQAVVEETVKIKIQPLTAAAFQPYGKVLERGELIRVVP